MRARRNWRAWRRLNRAFRDFTPAAGGPASFGPLTLEQLAFDLRRLDRQRRSGPTLQSQRWLAAVMHAYDLRLQLACQCVGVTGYLPHLDGLDRDLERLRLEAVLQAAGPLQGIGSVATKVEDRQAPRTPQTPPTPETPDARCHPGAVRLVGIAVHLLPPRHRPRYREEFLGELFELVRTQATDAQQLLYGARLITQAWALRRELGPG